MTPRASDSQGNRHDRSADERYVFISADTHATASPVAYRAYLDPAFRTAYDETLGIATSDNDPPPAGDDHTTDTIHVDHVDADTHRNDTQNTQGCVGEVIFPDGSPPFSPNGVLLSGPPHPDVYPQRRAGIHALNRWMADFAGHYPERRAGVGSVTLNNLDDTLADVAWIADHGLRGGVQLPNITPNVDWIPDLGDPSYDRLWAAIQDADLTINMHIEIGFPQPGPNPSDFVRFNTDSPHNIIRNVVLMILGGVFDRYPRLRVAVSEVPIGILASLVAFLDISYDAWQASGQLGTMPITDDLALAHNPSDYLATNVWFTASPPLITDLPSIAKSVGYDHLMIGNDYPHPESAYPYTRQVLRQVFHDWTPTAVRTVLCETPAALYGFDIDALRPAADTFGPTIAEIAEPLTDLPDNPNYTLVVNDRHRLASGRAQQTQPATRDATDSAITAHASTTAASLS